MTCHGTDAHAMTWDLACDLARFQDATVWASHARPPMVQYCDAGSSERRQNGDGGKGRNNNANNGGKVAHSHCHWPGVTVNYLG